jgi:transcriptional regulator with XRE-family HTH domain
MVSRRHTINEIERNALNGVTDLLGIKQEELADLADVSQAWLSITLSGKKSKRETQNLTRLARTLLDLFNEKRKSIQVEETQADEFSETLRRLSALYEPQSTAFVTPAGPAVPSNARNYIRRTLDKLVDECLESGNLSTYIVGPFQAGKTSLLLRFRDEAKKKGFETAYFSCKNLAKPRFFSDSATVFRLRPKLSEEETEKEVDSFFRSLKDTLTTTWGLNASPQLDEADFPTWAEKLLKFGPERQALVILDDLGYLSPMLRYKINSSIRIVKNTNSFVSFARGLVEPAPIILEGKKEMGHVESAISLSSSSPTTSISLLPAVPVISSSSFIGARTSQSHMDAVAITTSSVPAISSSSTTYGQSPFDWWFTEEQVRTLLATLEIDLGEDFTDIYQQYGGQPFLSHLVAANADLRRKGSDLRHYLKQFEVQWPAFELHKNLIRVTLVEAAFTLAFEGENLTERLTLKDFLEKLKNSYPSLMEIIGIESGANRSLEVSDRLKSFLLARKIIRIQDTGRIEPSCGWYKEIVQQLGTEIESGQIGLKFED